MDKEIKLDDTTINLEINELQDRELTIRKGKAREVLPELEPTNIDIHGTIGAPAEFLAKRINTGLFDIKDCHVLVDRDNVKITLIINERDKRRYGKIVGKSEYSSIFVKFGINGGKIWTPSELGLFLKMNRSYFPVRQDNMLLVSCLMNYTATINNKIERSLQENGSKMDNFQQVVNSNLPPTFCVSIPIFKGENREEIEIETFASVDGRNVMFSLLSPGAEEVRCCTLDARINAELDKIREIAPEMAIIEM